MYVVGDVTEFNYVLNIAELSNICNIHKIFMRSADVLNGLRSGSESAVQRDEGIA